MILFLFCGLSNIKCLMSEIEELCIVRTYYHALKDKIRTKIDKIYEVKIHIQQVFLRWWNFFSTLVCVQLSQELFYVTTKKMFILEMINAMSNELSGRMWEIEENSEMKCMSHMIFCRSSLRVLQMSLAVFFFAFTWVIFT